MDTFIIVLFIALAIVLVAALIWETVRLVRNYRGLEEESRKASLKTPQVVVVKQKAGEFRFAYLAMPDDTYKGEEETAAAVSEPAEELVEEPAEEPVEAVEAEPAFEEEPAAAELIYPEDSVILPKAERLTFEEKYERLDETAKGYLDEFAVFVEGMPDCSQAKQASAVAFKYKKGHIAKAIIRRDTVVLHFAIVNPELDRMVRGEKIKSIKVKPVEIRLTSQEDLALAKQTAEITVKYLRDDEQYRIEKRKEARREAARLKRAEAAQTAEEKL